MFAAFAALLAQATPATLPDIEVGHTDWNAIQRLESRVRLPNARLIEKVETIMRMGQCNLPGQRTRNFDIDINYAIRFDEQNQVDRIVVEDIGCPLIETLVGNMVSEMLRSDLFRLPAMRRDHWYGNALNFTLVA